MPLQKQVQVVSSPVSTSTLPTPQPSSSGFLAKPNLDTQGSNTPDEVEDMTKPPCTPASTEPTTLAEIPGKYDFKNTLGMKFVSIQPGKYSMGSSRDKFMEKSHEVILTQGFQMQNTEVTQGQWEAVMGCNQSEFKGNKNNPVETVSWEDVQEFIQKLNARGEGKYRLPTESEWEYAARAGTSTEYVCGDDENCLKDFGWYGFNSAEQTHPVGQKQPNAWGLFDVHGNVREWVQDWYGDYPDGPIINPMGADTGNSRIYRGSSWKSFSFPSRVAYRGIIINFSPVIDYAPYFDYALRSNRSAEVGFRLVKE